MPQIRLLIALVLAVVVIGGFFYSTFWWRVAPLAISVAWALAELVIERGRRRAAADSSSQHT
jgi:hypothetical protein